MIAQRAPGAHTADLTARRMAARLTPRKALDDACVGCSVPGMGSAVRRPRVGLLTGSRTRRFVRMEADGLKRCAETMS